jgi:FixJ family two-component response regulator
MTIAHAYVIDDEEIVRTSLSRLLRAIGVPSSGFGSGEAFLEQYGGPAQEEAGRILIVDIRMPGMSGLDLLERLQTQGSRMPAVVITGHTDEHSLARLTRLKAVGLLEKPFSLAQLKDMLARCG